MAPTQPPIGVNMPQVHFATLHEELEQYYEEYNSATIEDFPETDDEDDGPYWRYTNEGEMRQRYPTLLAMYEEESDEEDPMEMSTLAAQRGEKFSRQIRKDVITVPKPPPTATSRKTQSSGPAPPVSTESTPPR